MTEQAHISPVPRRILLATDLGARSDRALDRAISLARSWQAELVVAHALDGADVPDFLDASRDLPSWRRGPEPQEIATAALAADLGGLEFPVTTVVEEGAPVDVILKAAAKYACDLIVIAVARVEVLGSFLLGTTVDRLLRSATVPVLVVRARPHHPYRNVVVAADVSAASRAALNKAAQLFPQTPFHVFHAYQPPMSGMLGDQLAGEDDSTRAAKAELEAFLAETGIHRQHVQDILVERGDPQLLIQQYVRGFGADLVVLGSHGKGSLLELLLGSTSKSVLADLDCDALVVPKTC